jgi:CubicO group peptidase (beta-lactamase class C family)
MGEDQVPGVAIGLLDGQRVVWTEGFGLANIATQAPVSPETVFSVQSISKTYTATAFVRAIDRKLIGLDDRVVDILPGFAIRDRFGGHEIGRITMRQLLSHWAGLCQEAPVGNNYGDWHCSLKEHIASIEDSWLRLPVGRYYRYSNLGGC